MDSDYEVVKKFEPWFPHLRAISRPAESMPKMSPREALAILAYEKQCLYDGGTTLSGMGDAAFYVLEDLIKAVEARQVIPEN
jgi:hypothetical protein